MSAATVSPSSTEEERGRSSDSREEVCLREAVARIAASLVRPVAAASPRGAAPESRAHTEHIEIGNSAYSVRAELLVHADTSPVVVVAIERHFDARPPDRQLRVQFGLTRAEARVAALLADRRSNQEIAQQLGVTGHTARRHTEKVLLKLGIHRRTDVRRALLRCMQQGEAAPHSAHDGAAPRVTLATSREGSGPER